MKTKNERMHIYSVVNKTVEHRSKNILHFHFCKIATIFFIGYKEKKRGRNQNEALMLQKPADDFFCAFSESKIAFHLLITVSNAPPKGEGIDLARSVGSKHAWVRVSRQMNFQRSAGVRFACRLFILSVACQQANFMPQPSSLFLPERRAQLHPLQADKSYITWMRTRAGEP